MCFRSLRRDRPARIACAASAAHARSRGRPSACHPSAEIPPIRQAGRRRSSARRARLRAQFPQPSRHGSGLRQACRGTRRAAQARFWLRRGWNRHAFAADRQPAPARLSARPRRGRDQPAGLQQRGRRRRAAPPCARANEGGIVGVNLGANRESADRIADYVRLIETFAPVASYFSVNISSPNTPGLRELQQVKMLDNLLARVVEARARMSRVAGTTPVLIKIATDLTLGELDDIVGAARRHRVDGMIIGNTTVARPLALRDQATAQEAGGLSGRPLFALATRMLAETHVRVEGAFPLIGVGGIDSGEAAVAKIRAGACLIELYSALVFHGLRLV